MCALLFLTTSGTNEISTNLFRRFLTMTKTACINDLHSRQQLPKRLKNDDKIILNAYENPLRCQDWFILSNGFLLPSQQRPYYRSQFQEYSEYYLKSIHHQHQKRYHNQRRLALSSIVEQAEKTQSFSTGTPRSINRPKGFQFPPGNPNDLPKLEHLKYIESELLKTLPNFMKTYHPYGLYSNEFVCENYYQEPPIIIKNLASYALHLLWIRTKINFAYMKADVHILNSTIDEESSVVKIRWRIVGIPNKAVLSLIGKLKKAPTKEEVKDIAKQSVEWIDGYSIFFIRGDGRIYKHRIDRVMIDEEKVKATKKNIEKVPATAPAVL
ncbi:unnamed protein product [Didymodactylos carnosus]|uniref:Uncharacterized protein n=1 Tax=Didymodactylos carnosus TaxID=1234261 RepID=A0A814IER7_9BILA|nr:unnamed protein product [Didymodactylos carnosus]CAF1024762.1 unnamed protein product [Didymodactylos carnosus]CAF3630573.1 unnamed protein product [Didymodactylos carnosus]CAF3796037.1 unnamed protein product [Didymodactylos carnosus]